MTSSNSNEKLSASQEVLCSMEVRLIRRNRKRTGGKFRKHGNTDTVPVVQQSPYKSQIVDHHCGICDSVYSGRNTHQLESIRVRTCASYQQIALFKVAATRISNMAGLKKASFYPQSEIHVFRRIWFTDCTR